MRILRSIAWSTIAVASFPAARAAAQPAESWTVKQSVSGGQSAAATPVAPLRMLEVACRGATPVIGIGAPLDARVASVPVRFSPAGAAPIVLTMRRLGTSPAFAAPVTDRALLDMMISASSMTIEIAGRTTAIDMRGAAGVLRTALTACYAAPSAVAAPVATAAPVAASGDAVAAAAPLAAAILALAPAPGSRPVTTTEAYRRVPAIRRGGSAAGNDLLGELGVILDTEEGSSTLDGIEFGNEPVARGSTRMRAQPYDALSALKAAGATLTPFHCYLTDGNRTEFYRVAAPGKSPFWIESTNWPARGTGNYVFSVRAVFKKPPTAREIDAGMEEAPRRCPG